MGVQLLAGERRTGETDRAIQACNDYLRMGPGRSLRKLAQKYGKSRKNTVPSDSLATLEKWSADFEWQQRAGLYDAVNDAEKTERRRKEFESGLAQDFERVRELKRLANFLKKQIYATSLVIEADDGESIENTDLTQSKQPGVTNPYVWLADVKKVGSGEDAERVDIVRFNTPLLDQFRATLDDLAKETGGRRQKVDMEHSGSLGFHADDANQAERELDEWKRANSNEQKSNG